MITIPKFEDDPKRQSIAKCCIESFRIMNTAFPGVNTRHVLTQLSVSLCNIADRPANVSTIADMTGMSRQTARRALDDLVDLGFINRIDRPNQPWPLYVVTDDPIKQAEISLFVDGLSRGICETARQIAGEVPSEKPGEGPE